MTQSPPPCRTEERRTLISSTSAQHRGSRHRIHDTRGFSKAFLWGRDVLSEDQALNTTSSGSSSFSTHAMADLSAVLSKPSGRCEDHLVLGSQRQSGSLVGAALD